MGDEGTLYSQEVPAEGALVGVGAAIGATDGVVVAGADDAHGFPSRHVGGAGGLGKGLIMSPDREKSVLALIMVFCCTGRVL